MKTSQLEKKREMSAAERVRTAVSKLDEIAALERDLEAAHESAEKIREEIERIENEIADRRGDIARQVRLNGGALDVPGLARPLHVKTCRTLLYDADALLPWLKRNAPRFVRECVEQQADRRALKKELVFLRSRAYLPDCGAPVRGIRVIETESLVVPGKACAEPGSGDPEKQAG